ncbi:Fc receptor-like A [Dendropsophus ebraccatus]|uniref:Fc receptor-like A n=1 Tax=Dendropsophus ebraccatus TaxID=150705 RepID=UPI0038323159
MWYKENRVIRGWTDYAEYLIRKVDSNTAGTYKCEKDVGPYGGKYYDQSSISVEELFTTPTIKVWGHQVEGGNMTLTCETNLPSPRRNTQLQVTFYREGWIVQGSGVSDIYEVYNVQLEDSGKYSCEVKTTDGRVRKRSAERVIQIEELFSPPVLTVSPESVSDGDTMTLSCDTNLSDYRQNTDLQYAFYRDGGNLQGFTSSNKYEVLFIQGRNSENYTCEIRTSTNGVRKESQGLQIQAYKCRPSKNNPPPATDKDLGL